MTPAWGSSPPDWVWFRVSRTTWEGLAPCGGLALSATTHHPGLDPGEEEHRPGRVLDVARVRERGDHAGECLQTGLEHIERGLRVRVAVPPTPVRPERARPSRPSLGKPA